LQAYVTESIWPRARALGLDRQQADHLGSTYGSLAPAVLARTEANARLAERVCPNQSTILAQLDHAVADEWAMSLGDVLLRRTTLGLDAGQALDCLDRIADHLAPLLGWDASERARQIDAYHREIEPMRRFSRTRAGVT
jgi:glycerol-3-phosphate dehydrogenase